MSLFEDIAVSDLRFRLVFGPAVIVFACSLMVGAGVVGGTAGAAAGAVVGVALAVVVAVGIGRQLS